MYAFYVVSPPSNTHSSILHTKPVFIENKTRLLISFYFYFSLSRFFSLSLEEMTTIVPVRVGKILGSDKYRRHIWFLSIDGISISNKIIINQFNEANTVLPKQGSILNVSSNYRFLSLINVAAEILTATLASRLQPVF